MSVANRLRIGFFLVALPLALVSLAAAGLQLEFARAAFDPQAQPPPRTVPSAKTDAKSIKARILVCIGADDPMIPPEQRAGFESEMREAGVDWQLHLYGNTVHSFTNPEAAKRNMPEAIRYSAEADARSWAALLELFSETLGQVRH